jgi:acetyl-CoA C-acetyltransferase
MLQTAEQVAKRYNIGRDARTPTARAASSAPPPRRPPGKFNDEIAPITVTGRGRQGHGPDVAQGSDDREPTKASAPTPRWKAVSKIRSAMPGGVITPATPASSATAPRPAC